MGPTSERSRVEAALLEHPSDPRDMRRFATMRGRSERQLFISQPIAISRARFDQR
jgi:hypothetical protein